MNDNVLKLRAKGISDKGSYQCKVTSSAGEAIMTLEQKLEVIPFKGT